MNAPADTLSALTDHQLAAMLFAANPATFGGIALRGPGPARDAVVENLKAALGDRPVVRLPVNVDGERLLGGIDLTATLASGRSIRRPGLLEMARGGILIVPMAERIASDVAAQIALAMDSDNVALVLLDDGCEEEAPPTILMERLAFHCDISDREDSGAWSSAKPERVKSLTGKQRKAIAATAAAFGIASIRPLIFAERAALAIAALMQRTQVADSDIATAVALVLAPRATQFPDAAPPPPQPEPEPNEPPQPNEDGTTEQPSEDLPLEDMLLEAARAAIPPKLLDQLENGQRTAGRGLGGRAGQKQNSRKRGRPLGAIAGVPGGGKRLALIDTLRTAAPWQALRREQASNPSASIHIRKSDLRIRRFEERRETLTIFAVDASGSSALSRLAEAKGAVELMLAEAYVKRAEVALVAFRQAAAEILLPPTRSLTRARRALSALPGGGGTPLAAGLIAARKLAENAQRAGQTPVIALLTDGKGNIMLDGKADRAGAMADVAMVATGMAAVGLKCIIIDISPRPRAEAEQLANQLRGKYVPLPYANQAALVGAIEKFSA